MKVFERPYARHRILSMVLCVEVAGWLFFTVLRDRSIAGGVGLVILLAATGIIWSLISICRNRFRFTLRHVLVATALIATIAGLFGNKLVRIQRESAAVGR